MRYEHITDSCFSSSIGATGLSLATFQEALRETGPALDSLRRWHAEGDKPFLTLPEKRDDLASLRARADELRGRFTRLVVLGTGGSSLGGQALVALAAERAAPAPAIIFLDNVDPVSFERALAAGDLARTGFLVISKSGATAETMAQVLLALGRVRAALGADQAAAQFLCVAEPGESPLRRLAERHGMAILDHDARLGGRFSVLSLVGLLPALVAGLDGEALRAGAAEVLHALLGARQPNNAAPAVGAALGVGLRREQGIGTTVLMPYLDRLHAFGLWFSQLWAESLGKDGHGTTPALARGATDQHSQLQLYLDGPRDKMFSLVMLDGPVAAPAIDATLAEDVDAAYLAGKSLAELIAAEARATAATLAAAGRPVRLFTIPVLDEATLGALMMHAMLETVITAHVLGVDAFDQPAVERGKELTRRYLAEADAP